MKSIFIRIIAVSLGVALAFMVQFCTGGQVQFGPDGQPLAPAVDQDTLQAYIDQAQQEIKEAGEELAEDVQAGAEGPEKFPTLILTQPSLDPKSSGFMIKYGFPPEISPNLIFCTDPKSKLYEDALAANVSISPLAEIGRKLKLDLTSVNRLLLICRMDDEQRCLSWLLVVRGLDMSKLPSFEEVQIDQNVVYKGPEYLLAELDGMVILGTKDMIIFALDPNGGTIISTYFNGCAPSPVKLAVNLPRSIRNKLNFIKVDVNKPNVYLLSINSSYLADKKIEMTLSLSIDEFPVTAAAFKIDADMIDWQVIFKKISAWVAGGEVQKYGADTIKQEVYENIPQEPQINVKPTEETKDVMNLNQ